MQPVPTEVLIKAIKKTILNNNLTKELWQKYYSYQTFEEFQEFELYRKLRIKSKGEYPRFQITIDSTMLGIFEPYGGLDKWVKRYGWFVSYWNQPQRSYQVHITLEKNYGERVQPPQFLYRFEVTGQEQRILKRGFTPKKGDNEMWQYPPRVYLFTTYNLSKIREIAFHMINVDMSPEDIYYGDGHSLPITVYQVDTTKLNKGIKFFADLDAQKENAVWTYSNIPPQAISIIHQDESLPDVEF